MYICQLNALLFPANLPDAAAFVCCHANWKSEDVSQIASTAACCKKYATCLLVSRSCKAVTKPRLHLFMCSPLKVFVDATKNTLRHCSSPRLRPRCTHLHNPANAPAGMNLALNGATGRNMQCLSDLPDGETPELQLVRFVSVRLHIEFTCSNGFT